MDDLLTVKEVAIYLRLSRSQIYAMVAKKQIPHTRLSKKRLAIRKADLQKWLEKNSLQLL